MGPAYPDVVEAGPVSESDPAHLVDAVPSNPDPGPYRQTEKRRKSQTSAVMVIAESPPSRSPASDVSEGSTHLRRVLVGSAWSYRHPPAVGVELRRRSQGQPPEVLAYAWHAQCWLSSRFRSLAARRNRNVAVVAVARELAGFIWGLMTDHLDIP